MSGIYPAGVTRDILGVTPAGLFANYVVVVRKDFESSVPNPISRDAFRVRR